MEKNDNGRARIKLDRFIDVSGAARLEELKKSRTFDFPTTGQHVIPPKKAIQNIAAYEQELKRRQSVQARHLLGFFERTALSEEISKEKAERYNLFTWKYKK